MNPQRVTAVEYLDRAASGRSHPMLCACESAFEDDDAIINAYVKYKGFHEDLTYDHLVCELVANMFAVDLGLPAAEPCLVAVSPDFLELLPRDPDCEQIRSAFGPAGGVAFGSKAFQTVRRWDADNLVHKAQMEEATRLYLFDTLVENTDRGNRNPNLLASGLYFKVIDFGHSFQRCYLGDAGEVIRRPWQPGGIQNHFPGDLQHVMYSGLRNVPAETVDQFTDALEALPDEVIESYVEAVPEEWGQDTACKIVDYLLGARENAKAFGTRIKEVLA